MKERQSGKIVAVTSAAPLRGIPNTSGYCAARGAQNAFIRAIGLELAKFNIQVNAIAQNYVRNETYYPDTLLQNEKFCNMSRGWCLRNGWRNLPKQLSWLCFWRPTAAGISSGRSFPWRADGPRMPEQAGGFLREASYDAKHALSHVGTCRQGNYAKIVIQ